MNWIAAGLVFGFFGSVHCIGMCGPLAISLPGSQRARWRFLLERLLYNTGRLCTYVALGGLIGFLGHTATLAGTQQALSVGIGVLMILGATVPWISRQLQRIEQAPAGLVRRVMKPIGSLYERGGPIALLLIGLLNGLLPCGFVYAALATAVTSGTVSKSLAFMTGFGLGTYPAMLGVSLLGRLASSTWRTYLQRLLPLGLGFVGLLLILRGLGLGSMISPILPEAFPSALLPVAPFGV